MQRSRKAKIAISTLVVIIVGLILAAAIIIPGVRTLTRIGKSFDAFGPGKCDTADRNIPITEYKNNIRNYALRQREDGEPNELYSPEDAVRHFKTFFACYKEEAFEEAQLNANKREIVTSTQAAYISWGEDLCNEYVRIPTADRDARSAIDDEHADLVDDYYTTFEELQDTLIFRDIVHSRIQYTGPSSCN